jgi:gluconolactonase
MNFLNHLGKICQDCKKPCRNSDFFITCRINQNLSMMKKLILFLGIMISFNSCQNAGNKTGSGDDESVVCSFEFYSDEASLLIDSTVAVEELAKGFRWAEGPVWLEEINALLFSDVPDNKMYKWSEKDGLSVFLDPSGFTPNSENETGDGSNGLAIDGEGDLVICQHGNRQLAMLKSGLKNPASDFISLTNNYYGKKFNSPNDLAIKSNGDIYFTDPPYGLRDEKEREIEFNGVYLLKSNGDVILLIDSLSRPNGIAFSPDEKTLYVANSDPNKAVWYSYLIDESGMLQKPAVFFDATQSAKTAKGLPDGLKVHSNGTIFATGPGGVFIFTPEAKLAGMIKTSKPTANLAFDKEEKFLYLTTTDRLLRVKMK